MLRSKRKQQMTTYFTVQSSARSDGRFENSFVAARTTDASALKRSARKQKPGARPSDRKPMKRARCTGLLIRAVMSSRASRRPVSSRLPRLYFCSNDPLFALFRNCECPVRSHFAHEGSRGNYFVSFKFPHFNRHQDDGAEKVELLPLQNQPLEVKTGKLNYSIFLFQLSNAERLD